MSAQSLQKNLLENLCPFLKVATCPLNFLDPLLLILHDREIKLENSVKFLQVAYNIFPSIYYE